VADPLDKLRDYKAEIDAEMGRFMAEAPIMFGVELSDHSRAALQHLTDYSTRTGKRIRGSLVALAYDTAAGTKHAKQAIQLGVVLELMQNYLLIVDDVMDKSAVRRSQPTLHELYRELATDFGGEHEANMLAVNVGVLAQHLANLLLSTIDVPAERLPAAFRVLHTNIAATGFGQLDDLYQQPGRVVSGEDIIHKYRLKSSYYTFVNPLQLGFTMAGFGDERVLQACSAYGEPAGIAFQLHDDYLGIFGDADKLGKPNLDDIREGKYTLLVHYTLEHAIADDAKTLRTMLGNPAASATDLEIARGIITESGALDYCQTQARHYAEQAKVALQTGSLGDETFHSVLTALVDYSVSREK
jgi:geranylgeranyl diphosphate synthase type I